MLKLSEPASILRLDGVLHRTQAEPLTKPVVDTTAAGDSFAAAYIAARLAGAKPVDAARAGHASPALWYVTPVRLFRATAMPA